MLRQLLSGRLKTILIISIAVQFLGLCVFVLIFVNQQRLLEETVSDKFTAQIGSVENEMTWSAECLTDMAADAVRFRMDASHRDLDWIGKLTSLRQTFSMLQNISGRDYHFFSWSGGDQRFLELTTVNIPFEVYRPIRQYLTDSLMQMPSGIWKLEQIGDRDVLFCVCRYGTLYMGAWIPGDELLRKSNAEGGYSVRFVPAGKTGGQRTGLFPFSEKKVAYPLRAPVSGFMIELTIPADRQLVGLSAVQLVQLLLWLQVLVVLIALTVSLSRNLLRPVRNLRNILAKYQDRQIGAEQADIGETVSDAYEIVRALGRQVDDLSADLYRKELEIKKTELSFKNLQIRPHFIVNCFAMISGMAQINDTTSIKQVLVDLADYFRYILHDSMDMVTLAEEMDHIRCLIQIRGKISRRAIRFDPEIAPEAENERIPVLSLATLAENAIRCAGGDEDSELRLRLKAARDGEILRIEFMDNGPGMAQELMDEINSDLWQREKNGHHIGIGNMLDRLKLIYEGRAKIRFSRDDGDLGGTRVWIAVPAADTERKKEHE